MARASSFPEAPPTRRVRRVPGALVLALAAAFLPPFAVPGSGQVTAIPAGDPLNPTPHLTSLNVDTLFVTTSGERLITVAGSGFVSGARVRVNSQNRTTYFVSSDTLRFISPSGDNSAPGSRQVTVFNPEPGGGLSNAVSYDVVYAPPTLSRLEPATVSAGSEEGLWLRLVGAGFVSASRVFVAGVEVPKAPLFGGSRMNVTVPAELVTGAGALAVQVRNPAPGGGDSETRHLEVTAAADVPEDSDAAATNPAPTIASLDGDTAFVEQGHPRHGLTGTGFVGGSIVRVDAQDRLTTWRSPTQLSVALSSTDVATPGVRQVHVFNPEPGGGLSNAVTLTVVYPAPILDQFSPASVTAGTTSRILLLLDGSGFVRDSRVVVAGRELDPSLLRSGGLRVQLPTDLIATPARLPVQVVNPAPGGGTSATRYLDVATPPNPVPTVTSADPSQIVRPVGAGAGLRVHGTDFVEGADVVVDGVPHSSRFVSAEELEVMVPESALDDSPTPSLSVRNPAPGGGESNAVDLEVRNALPAIDAIEPAWLEAGRPEVRVRVTGTGFVPASGLGPGSVVRWNGEDRPTTWVGPADLEVLVSAEDMRVPAAGRVSVYSAAPGGGSSAEVQVEVRGAANPAPSLTSAIVEPDGSRPGLVLTARGRGFVQGSVVLWDGRELETTFGSEELLTARVPPGLARPRRGDEFPVRVSNAPPGGGLSGEVRVRLPQ